MSIWKKEISIEDLNSGASNMVKHLGIAFTEVGDDYIEGKMPVDSRTTQPYGILHGGASVVLAETLGSLAGFLALAEEDKVVVGASINANHIRSVRSGYVIGRATAVHLGRRSQIWQIDIKNEEGKMVCASRLTLSVVELG